MHTLLEGKSEKLEFMAQTIQRLFSAYFHIAAKFNELQRLPRQPLLEFVEILEHFGEGCREREGTTSISTPKVSTIPILKSLRLNRVKICQRVDF